MPERQKIVDLVDRLSRIAHGLQFAEGLNPAQWEALRYVARANRTSCSPGALADFMGSTKGTVSQTLKALEAKGLVHRSRLAGDRRNVRLTLTPAGKALLERDPLSTITDALENCPVEQRVALIDGIEGILRAVQEREQLPAFGLCPDCVHFQPERCRETNAVGCHCGISGEHFSAIELDRICADFAPTR